MTDDLSAADARQLELWAYGRHSATITPELAEAALRELARRAAAIRTEQVRDVAAVIRTEQVRDAVAIDAPLVHDDTLLVYDDGRLVHDDTLLVHDDGQPVSATPARLRHEHRMLRTGQAGLVAALLAVGAGVVTLSQPDPDPVAMFERPPTAADLGWKSLLEDAFGVVITLGPRVVDLGDGLDAVVYRSAAVTGGLSTTYDPYCIAVSDRSDGADSAGADSADDPRRGIINGICALPERLLDGGLELPLWRDGGGADLELVIWGPEGEPRLEVVDSLDGIGAARSVLDWMLWPTSESDAAGIVDQPDLLLGPSVVPLFVEGSDSANVSTVAYLLRGQVEGADPVFCVHSTVPDEGDTEVCAPLAAVRRAGLEYTVTADGRPWVVSIGADGEQRADTFRAAD